MEKIIMLALAVSAISFTISFTSIFMGVREWISRIHPKLEELIHCPWCLSHYVALVAMFTAGKYTGFIDFVAQWFAMICLSGLCHYVLLRAYKPVMENMMNRKIDQAQARARSKPKLAEETSFIQDLIN